MLQAISNESEKLEATATSKKVVVLQLQAISNVA